MANGQQQDIFTQYRLNAQYPEGDPRRERETGHRLVLSWEGAEPTPDEIEAAFSAAYGEGTWTKGDLPALGATFTTVPTAMTGAGIPALAGAAAAGGSLGAAVQQALIPDQVGRLTILGMPRGSQFGLGAITGQKTPEGELDIGEWYPGRRETRQDIASEIGTSAGFEGALEGATGGLFSLLRGPARLFQRVAMSPSGEVMGKSRGRTIDWSLNEGLGPMGSRRGRERVIRPQRLEPTEYRPGWVDPTTGQRLRRGRDLLRKMPLVGHWADDAPMLQSQMVESSQRAREIVQPYGPVDVLDMSGKELQQAIKESPVGGGETLGSWVEQGQWLNWMRNAGFPPEVENIYIKYLDPTQPGRVTLTVEQALRDKAYLEKQLNPLYDKLSKGEGGSATTALAATKALRDFLSDRVQQTIHRLSPQDAAAFVTQNKETQTWGDLISLVRESDPSLVKQMGLGFAATGGVMGGAGFSASGDPFLSGLGAIAGTIPGIIAGSPPLQSYLARRMWGASHGGARAIAPGALRLTGSLASQGSPPTVPQGGGPSAGPTIENAIRLAMDNPEMPQPDWLKDLLGNLVPTLQAEEAPVSRLENPQIARTRAISSIAPTSTAAIMRRSMPERRVPPTFTYGR